ncbi:hypothetical protein GGF31_000021 [Allomyces arbusculus]|nr:hypothetical protein GGF31_000021 [Allomyces arbusculus]
MHLQGPRQMMNQRERYTDVVRRDHAVVVALAEQVATADETVRQLAEQLVRKDDQIAQLQTQVRALILIKACKLTPDEVGDLPDPDAICGVEAQGVHKLSRTHLVALVRKKEQTIRALVSKFAETRADRDRFRAMAEHWRVLVEPKVIRGDAGVDDVASSDSANDEFRYNVSDDSDDVDPAHPSPRRHRPRTSRSAGSTSPPDRHARKRLSPQLSPVRKRAHAHVTATMDGIVPINAYPAADQPRTAKSSSPRRAARSPPVHGASPSPASPPLDLIYLLPDPAVAERKILDRKPPTTTPNQSAASPTPTRTIPADLPALGIAPRALTKLRAEYSALYTERDQLAAELAAVRDEVAAERREHAAQVAELRAAVRRLKEFLWPVEERKTET